MPIFNFSVVLSLQASPRSRLKSLRYHWRPGKVVCCVLLCRARPHLLMCLFVCYVSVNLTSAPSRQNFVVKADDLEQIAELGRGAYGVVDKMRHVPSGVIMAVKVGWEAAAQVT